MYLAQIFRASPLMGLALFICLLTILWCFLMARRQRGGLDKVLTGVLGLVAVYEAIRILKDCGVLLFPGIGHLDGWVDFLIASMYFIAALILKLSSVDRTTTKVKLRLVEANEKTSEIGKGFAGAFDSGLMDACPLCAFAVDSGGVVTYWNPAAERMLGWSREDVVGHPLPSALHGKLLTRSGHEVDALVWTSAIGANGSRRGTLTMAAQKSSLMEAPHCQPELAARS